MQFIRRWSPDNYERSVDGQTATIEWEVILETGETVSTATIESASNFPIQINSPHPDFPGKPLRCDRIRIPRVGFKTFRVAADFSVPSGGGDHEQDQPENPLAEPARFRWESVLIPADITRDVDGNPIQTSIRRVPETKPQREFEAIVLTVIKNLPGAFNTLRALNYGNTVSSDVFLGAQPKEVRCRRIYAAEEYRLSDDYTPTAHEFEFRSIDIWRDHPHQLEIQDVGFEASGETSNGKRGLFRLEKADGLGGFTEPVNPVPLDGFGMPIKLSEYVMREANGDFITFLNTGTPPGATRVVTDDAVFLRYNIFPSKPYAPIAADIGAS